MLNVTLSLYIMDNIGKRDLTRSEPLRLAVATLAWGVAPFLGVWLMQRYGLWAPAALSLAAVAALLAAVFWALRLAEGGPIRAGRPAPAPLRAPARRGAPLRGAAAAAARLGDRLRPLGVLDDLLHLRADPDGRGRARRRPPAGSPWRRAT